MLEIGNASGAISSYFLNGYLYWNYLIRVWSDNHHQAASIRKSFRWLWKITTNWENLVSLSLTVTFSCVALCGTITTCRVPAREQSAHVTGSPSPPLYAQLDQLDASSSLSSRWMALRVLLLWLAASHNGTPLLIYNTNGHTLLSDLGSLTNHNWWFLNCVQDSVSHRTIPGDNDTAKYGSTDDTTLLSHAKIW